MPFTDVRSGAWYEDAVRYVYENGLMTSSDAKSFGPNDHLTRAQLTQILYNKEHTPATENAAAFNDVTAGAWYCNAVIWAAENGIVNGCEGSTFGPNDDITREQLAVMLWRYAGEPETAGTLDGFTDPDKASGYAEAALKWAVENGIVTGKGNGILDPQGKAARAEAAAMLTRYFKMADE